MANDKHTIEVPDFVVVQANRYMLGRMTYAVGEHCQWLISAWPKLSDWAKDIIQTDVDRHFDFDDRARTAPGKDFPLPLGMNMDRQEWEKVRALWAKEPKP